MRAACSKLELRGADPPMKLQNVRQVIQKTDERAAVALTLRLALCDFA